jgi:diketogulonate reductase-like aldo/keto reductase
MVTRKGQKQSPVGAIEMEVRGERGFIMKLSLIPNITLNDGDTIPQLGFGVFQIAPRDTAKAVSNALEIGYRHIDTAEMYGNEKGVGEAIRASGLERGEVFVTSKLNNGFHRPDDARKAFSAILSELGFDYVDLFLIHWPLPTLYSGDFVSTWKMLEEFYRGGHTRSIGVSNFQIEHLERLAAKSDLVPAVNQIEVRPFFTNGAVRAYCQKHRMAIEAWSPSPGAGCSTIPPSQRWLPKWARPQQRLDKDDSRTKIKTMKIGFVGLGKEPGVPDRQNVGFASATSGTDNQKEIPRY